MGTLQLIVMLVGLATIALVGLGLRFTIIGKQMRALADNMALAEASGIDTLRTIRITWAVAGGLAALAGILYASAIGSINPNFGVTILLSLFAAAVLGGIGNAYGALAGGIVIGLAQEWSHTVLQSALETGGRRSAILILTLLLLPRGIFGRSAREHDVPISGSASAVIAGIYGIFALGLQINVGFTGLLNFGQAGFMSIGAYTMGMLVVDGGLVALAAMPVAILAANHRRSPGWVAVAALALRLFRHRHYRLRGDRSLHVPECRVRRRQPGYHRLRSRMAPLGRMAVGSFAAMGLGHNSQLPLFIAVWFVFALA